MLQQHYKMHSSDGNHLREAIVGFCWYQLDLWAVKKNTSFLHPRNSSSKNKIMAETVLVMVGEWECSQEGKWSFLVENAVMAQNIVLQAHMKYTDLKASIEHEFEMAETNMEAELSFWQPSDMAILSKVKVPPVCIKNDSGLMAFRQARETNKGLTLFVSFSSRNLSEGGVPGVRGARLRQTSVCSERASGASGAGLDLGNKSIPLDTNCLPTGHLTLNSNAPEGKNRLNWNDGIIRLGDSTSSDTEAIDPTGRPLISAHDTGTSRKLNGKDTVITISESPPANIPKDVPTPTAPRAVRYNHEQNKDPGENSRKHKSARCRLKWDSSRYELHDKTSSESASAPIYNNPTQKDIGVNNEATTSLSKMELENPTTSKGKKPCEVSSSDDSRKEDNIELHKLSKSHSEAQDNINKQRESESEEPSQYDSEEELCEDYENNIWERLYADQQREMQQNMSDLLRGAREQVTGDVHVPDLNRHTNEDSDDAVVPEYVAPPIHQHTIQLPELNDGTRSPSRTQHAQTPTQRHISSRSTAGTSAAGEINMFSLFETQRSEDLANKLPIVEASSSEAANPGCEINSADVDAHELQSALANIYADIRQPNLVQLADATPVIDDPAILLGEETCLDFDQNNDELVIGRIFKDKEEMQHVLSLNAIRYVYNYKYAKSDKTRVIAKCKDRNCNWRVFAATMGGGSENIQIRTARLEHTCNVSTRSEYGKKASSKVVAKVIKRKYGNGQDGPRAVEIPDIVLAELKVSISYMKAWYAKEKAIASTRGSEEASYNLLLGYLSLLAKANPGTRYSVKTTMTDTGHTRFKYLFFSLGPSIAAIPYLRKVIIIDGTTIKTKFKGTLLTASYQDGNFQVFPLAFGVVDGENDPAWEWFFAKLSEIVPDEDDLMFISDRHSSIYSALQKVYPKAQHGACLVHLVRNVRSRFKGRGLCDLVTRAGMAYTIGSFKYWFREIEHRNPECAEYLRSIGFQHWTQAYCRGMRYNIASTNIAEALNAALRKALQLPIVSLVETIRMMLMQWFCWRRAKAATMQTVLTPEVEKMIMKHLEKSTSHATFAASPWIYQVNSDKGITYTVDLEKCTCTCNVFDKLMIPCSHALAAARVAGVPITGMANGVYKADAFSRIYTPVVMPVQNMEDQEVPAQNPGHDINPPEAKRGSGRPRKRRMRSTLEPEAKRKKTGQNKCSRCKGTGHNKTTCQEPLH